MKFYVTFGVQYAREPHPVNAGFHPDGVLEIGAKDIETARSLAFSLLGRKWSMIHREDEMEDSWHFYPRGITHRLEGLQIVLVPKHTGGNAEDCARCDQLPPLPYPWICPGEPVVEPS